jgi:SAM-dependent methyltransferase
MLPCSEACERNKGPILDALRLAFAESERVLEIGSGTGQHAVYFTTQLLHLTWQPTERPAYLQDLRARIELEGPRNLLAPTLLDVKQSVWPARGYDAVFSANTLHIMAWAEVQCLFRGVGEVLLPGGVLCLYGPFRDASRGTSASNENFDRMLRERDPLSGLRDLELIVAEASRHGMALRADHAMPANNRLLEMRKD